MGSRGNDSKGKEKVNCARRFDLSTVYVLLFLHFHSFSALKEITVQEIIASNLLKVDRKSELTRCFTAKTNKAENQPTHLRVKVRLVHSWCL